jgi:hypothetical protein
MEDEDIVYFYTLLGVLLKNFKETSKMTDEDFIKIFQAHLSSNFYFKSDSKEDFKKFISRFVEVCEVLWKERIKAKHENDKSFDASTSMPEGTENLKNGEKDEKAPTMPCGPYRFS